MILTSLGVLSEKLLPLCVSISGESRSLCFRIFQHKQQGFPNFSSVSDGIVCKKKT
ncbi:MAG: hypothetical protein LIO71_07280 [Ruminococcus sp.]|nr:hypothetical protein [Ruminococcus sp.]